MINIKFRDINIKSKIQFLRAKSSTFTFDTIDFWQTNEILPKHRTVHVRIERTHTSAVHVCYDGIHAQNRKNINKFTPSKRGSNCQKCCVVFRIIVDDGLLTISIIPPVHLNIVCIQSEDNSTFESWFDSSQSALILLIRFFLWLRCYAWPIVNSANLSILNGDYVIFQLYFISSPL